MTDKTVFIPRHGIFTVTVESYWILIAANGDYTELHSIILDATFAEEIIKTLKEGNACDYSLEDEDTNVVILIRPDANNPFFYNIHEELPEVYRKRLGRARANYSNALG